MGNIAAATQVHERALIRYSGVFLMALIMLLTGCTVQTTSGQKIPKKAEKYYDEGVEHLHWDRFDEAETSLKAAVQKAPHYTKAWGKLTELYQRRGDYNQLYDASKMVIGLKPNYSPYIYLHFAEACLATKKYEEGLDALKIIEQTELNKPAERQRALLQQNLEFARDNYEEIAFTPQPLTDKVNTPNNEYFPSLTADEQYLYFTRHETVNPTASQENIFVTEQVGDSYGKAYKMFDATGSLANFGSSSISADGRLLFFTICDEFSGYGNCDIYYAENLGGQWSEPKNLGQPVNSPVNEKQPQISADGQTLYFASNRRSGYGGLDLWQSRRLPDGNWSKPTNLGPTVNTPFDDEKPFVHPDNRSLYFVSVGHPGFGQQDIFYSRREATGNWLPPTNLGSPYNSFYNERSIFITLDGRTALYATDRFNGKGNSDIYTFQLPETTRPDEVTYVKGTVKAKATGNPLQAKVEILPAEAEQVMNSVLTDEKNGGFLLTLPLGNTYTFNVSKKGYLFYSENLSLEGDVNGDMPTMNIQLEQISAGKKVVLNNIFFEKDEATLTKSDAALNKILAFLQENPGVSVEIGGHTDNTGTPAYNLKLSQKRARAVYNYLVKAGIDAERLTFLGYGEKQPVADNDTPEGRAKNRRTEITITGAGN